MIDQTDIEILNLLTRNSRMQWQEIGEEVHLTGQAVKNRINRMKKLGIIEAYTLKINFNKIGKEVIASTQKEVVGLLDEILQYGNYKINLSIENIK